ncbi:outer membrane beta-barrel protein [Bradyrhizobium sp. SSBR45R]|uniref:outer membrane protein n=2 Tax=unclassified Bradyrhizobium TaxID=2631580 RepID=UPI0024E14C3F|nr:outer membrane beta-barrel protein [Bradyrhizobium sp. SSBR45R]
MAWSRQQQNWSQVANAAPLQPVQQPGGNAANPPPAKPPVVANPPPNPPPPNNPGGNNGGWKPPYKPPYKPPVYGHHGDKGWWQPGKYHHEDNYKDHKWTKYDQKHDKPDHDDGYHWPKSGWNGGDNKHADHDWPWQAKPYKDDKYKDDKHVVSGWSDKGRDDDHDKSGGWSQLHSSGYSDRYAWLRHDEHDKHDSGGWGGKKDDDHDKPAFGWSKQPSKGEYERYAWLKPDKDDGDKNDKQGGYGWQKQPAYDKHDKDTWQKDAWQKDNWKDGWQKDKDDWQKHDGNYHHGDHAWKPPVKPGWPPKNPPPPNNPPPNNGGGQPNPPQQGNNGGAQNPPPVAGGGAVPVANAALQLPTAVSANGSDAIGGLQVGCDYQIDRLVLGVQAMADLGVINGSSALGPQLTINSATRNLYTATLRAGYLVTPEIMAYVRGGAAWTRTSVAVVNNATGQTAMAAFNRSGWTVGAGVEWMFARNWSAFAEYDYADFGTVTGTLPGAAAVTGGPNVVSQKTQLHTALIGVNYRFEMLSRGGR